MHLWVAMNKLTNRLYLWQILPTSISLAGVALLEQLMTQELVNDMTTSKPPFLRLACCCNTYSSQGLERLHADLFLFFFHNWANKRILTPINK